MSKKNELNVGDVVKVELEDGTFCFGRVLEEPLIAFYDLNVESMPSIEDIILSPVLFTVWVMNHAVTSGRWSVVGSLPLDEELLQPVKLFKQDPISKEVCVYINAEEIPASFDECKDLERAAVWNPEHVEDRLRDHYSGTQNQWVESLKIK